MDVVAGSRLQRRGDRDDYSYNVATSWVTRSKSIQDTVNTKDYAEMDARHQRVLNKLAPYLQAASASDVDHGPEDEDIARGVSISDQ